MKTNKFSFLQRVISYICPLKLSLQKSAINGILSLVLSNGVLQLETNKSIYSQGVKYGSFNKAFKFLKIAEQNFNNVLILGGGLCSIPQMLQYKFNQNTNYTVIELDDLIIQWANKYLEASLLQQCRFVKGDAFKVIKALNGNYDLICIDLYIDDIVPSKALEPAFLKTLEKLMFCKKSYLVFSLMKSAKLSSNDIDNYFKNIFQQCFPTARLLKTKGNVILTNR